MAAAVVNRKRHLSEFRDLFTVLFKIPDPDVHIRVINAINGIIKDSCDCARCQKEVKNAETQTEATIVNNIAKKEAQVQVDHMDLDIGPYSAALSNDSGEREIKRRKRSKRVPKVEKVNGEVKPEIKLKQEPSLNVISVATTDILKENRIVSWVDNVDIDTLSEPPNLVAGVNDLKALMKEEFLGAFQPMNGLFPVHKAIKQNDYKRFKRQLYIYNFIKQNINECRTENGDSPIQLAIKLQSQETIIQELLDNGAIMDELDEDGNTLIHLAISFTATKSVLTLLLKKIKIEFLAKTNDHGLTCLHLAAIEKKFLHLKVILDFIDEQLGIITPGHGLYDEAALIKLYINEFNNYAQKDIIKLNKDKMKIINETDLKHGQTALFYAVRNESKAMVFMLVNHLADPRIENHSGCDCISYASEYSTRNPQILTALDHAVSYITRCQSGAEK